VGGQSAGGIDDQDAGPALPAGSGAERLRAAGPPRKGPGRESDECGPVPTVVEADVSDESGLSPPGRSYLYLCLTMVTSTGDLIIMAIMCTLAGRVQ